MAALLLPVSLIFSIFQIPGLDNHMPAKNHKESNDKRAGIIIANDLRSGLTVFLTATAQWSVRVSEALVVRDEKSASEALGIAANDEANNKVTGAYLADSNDYGEPIVLRESLRVQGPSIEYRPGKNSIKRTLPLQISPMQNVSGQN